MISRRDLRSLLSGPFYLDGITRGYVTSGTTTTLVDSSADGILDTAYDTDRFENSFLYLPVQSASSPYTGRGTEEEQRVQSYTPSTGTIEIGRSFAQTPTLGEYYELHTHGASPATINSAIKWACKNARTENWFMLGGMIEDGEMQSESMASWVIDSGVEAGKMVYSNETTTKRVMRVRGTTTGPPTNGVWQNVVVQAGHTMQLYALVKSTAGADGKTAGLKIKNLQNIASPNDALEINPTFSGTTPIVYSATGLTNDDIYYTTTGEEEFWGGSFTVPTGCSSISIGLLGSGDWSALALYDNVQQEVRWPGFLMPHDQYTLGTGYFTYYGHAAQEATTVLLRAPMRPEGPTWRIAPATIPGALAIRAAVPIPYPNYDTDSYPPNLENYLLAGAFRYMSQQMARPNTLDNVRFEGLRVKADRDWQAYSQSRNPMSWSRMVWGNR